jgi:diaminopimelate epimerase
VGETQASGTGATASAYIAHTVHGVNQPVTVHLRGGVLTISFDEDGAWMDGPAEVVFSGALDDPISD